MLLSAYKEENKCPRVAGAKVIYRCFHPMPFYSCNFSRFGAMRGYARKASVRSSVLCVGEQHSELLPNDSTKSVLVITEAQRINLFPL